jgi:pectin methylesterase-like acyl-CoA thioesterase
MKSLFALRFNRYTQRPIIQLKTHTDRQPMPIELSASELFIVMAAIAGGITFGAIMATYKILGERTRASRRKGSRKTR